LSDLGIKDYMIGSATIAVIAQRLVRKLCNHCKTEVKEPLQEIKKHNVPQNILDKYQSCNIYKPKGCEKCANSGYKGRIIVLEILQIDKQLEDMISNRATALEILNVAKSRGMKTLSEDAYMKVLEGTTSFSEIARVVLDSRFLEVD